MQPLNMQPMTIEYIAETLHLPLKKIRILVSKMSGKLEHLLAINSSPTNNPFCLLMSQNPALICSECYSLQMARTHRKNANESWYITQRIMSLGIVPDILIPYINAAYIRGDAHGELENVYSLLNLYRIAEKNQHATMAIWTKRKDLVRKAKQYMKTPDNVILVYSEPRKDKINRTVPKNFNKIFNCISPDHPEKDQVNCGSKQCFTCLACYTKDNGTDVLIEEITTQASRSTRGRNRKG